MSNIYLKWKKKVERESTDFFFFNKKTYLFKTFSQNDMYL